jgi:hypothetical protein
LLEAKDSIRPVADLSVGGGVAFAIAGAVGVVPSLTIFGAVGVAGSTGLGGVMAIDANFAFGPRGSLVTVAFAPGLRLGSRSHLDLCVGPALMVASGTAGVLLVGAVIAQGHIELVGPLALHLALSAAFDGTGLILSPTVGLGASLF